MTLLDAKVIGPASVSATAVASRAGTYVVSVAHPNCSLSSLPVVAWQGYEVQGSTTDQPLPPNESSSVGPHSKASESLPGNEELFFPFDVPWNGSYLNSSLSAAFWVEAAGPAGSLGPVRVSDSGHFEASGTGKRVRLWGANLVAGAAIPPKAFADGIARKVSSAGFNAVRFTMID